MNHSSKLQLGKDKQALRENIVHDWYRFVLAFPDHLVRQMCERLGVTEEDIVLDPFCGTGTTLVECKKMGVRSVGIEANPSSVFASRVKTRWDLDPALVKQLLDMILEEAKPLLDLFSLVAQPLFAQPDEVERIKQGLLKVSPPGRYLVSSGMIRRKWISEIPFYKTLVLHRAIDGLDAPQPYKDLLLLALVAVIVEDVANISFGPELYVSRSKLDVDVANLFAKKVNKMIDDLHAVNAIPSADAEVFLGDSRECDRILIEHGIPQVDFVITSPPYPTEKDYTRNTRLELVYLGYVTDRESLQRIKRMMVRSHSKGIYKNDHDGLLVKDIPEVQRLVAELREKSSKKTYGFAKVYPRIIEEYFGGMLRHLRGLARVMRTGGRCAYVVGEQRTYLRTYTPTAKILGIIAESEGFAVEEILTWRVRKGTTGSGERINEEILMLRRE